jgi:hypothetical protein
VARRRDAGSKTRLITAVGGAGVVAAVVLAGLLWTGAIGSGSWDPFGSSGPYAGVETAAGWDTGCYPKTVVAAQAKFSRWAGPRANTAGL